MNFLDVPFQALGRVGPRLIMIAAMVTSYATQYHLFLSWGIDRLTSAVAPAVIDLLAITCAEILHDQRVTRGKGAAGFVLALAGAGSMAANWLAGASAGDKAVHASMVLAYVLAELVVGRVRREPVQRGAAKQVAVTEVRASDAQAEDLPEAPVSPAVPSAPAPAAGKARKRGPYGPRDPERGYAPSTLRKQRAEAKQAAQPVA